MTYETSYVPNGNQRALNWKSGYGYSHHFIDDGSRPGKTKATPLMGRGGQFDSEVIIREFRIRAVHIETEWVDFISGKIADYHLTR